MMAGALYRYVRYALCFRGKVTPLAAGCESPACDAPGESLAPGKRPAAPARPPPAVAGATCGEAGLERLADGLVVRPPVPHGEADADARLVAAANRPHTDRKKPPPRGGRTVRLLSATPS